MRLRLVVWCAAVPQVAFGAPSLWQLAQREIETTSTDVCGHISYEDIEFIAKELVAEGVDATPEGWALERSRILNTDTATCPDRRGEYVPTGFKHGSGRRKVFGIGLSKTGTTSLSNALLAVGYMNSDMADGFWEKVVDAATDSDAAAFWAGTPSEKRASKTAARVAQLFRTKSGATDLPTAAFVDELLAAFPTALFVDGPASETRDDARRAPPHRGASMDGSIDRSTSRPRPELSPTRPSPRRG